MSDSLSSRSSSLITVEVISLVILNALSLTGNILVCMSVYKNVRLRTTTNLYIIALAVSDLLSAVFVMPIGIGVLITGEWIFGESICQLHAFFSLFVIYISPVTMGLTAVNRYVRICRSTPAIRQTFFSEKVTFVVGYGLVFCCLLHSSPSPGWSSSVRICTRVRSVLHCSSQRDRKNDPLQHCPHFLFFNPAHSYSF